MGYVDLHIHTVYSDGTDTLESLELKLREKNIEYFSVTDLNSIEGCLNMISNPPEGMTLIPGVEFSCFTESRPCRILGYGYDLSNMGLRNFLEEMKNSRDGCVEAVRAIQTIRAAGGIAVWAHPLGGEGENGLSNSEFERQLQELLACGIQGLECWYSRYGKGETEKLIRAAEAHELWISGGSGYSGESKRAQLGRLNRNKSVPESLSIMSALKQYNDKFEDIHREEDETDYRNARLRIQEMEVNLDRIRGGLFGGAVGDALGYPVEFLSEQEIRRRYGEHGIQNYELDFESGQALISDDTQMSLFTANGILYGDTRGRLRGIRSMPSVYVNAAYKDWYATQTGAKKGEKRVSWLLDLPDLYHRRAPGLTCMKALMSAKTGSVTAPINHSKGCGGIMRVAPLGLHYHWKDREELDKEGAAIAALTHGHPLGYMPAAMLTHIVNVAVYRDAWLGDTLEDAVKEAMITTAKLFAGDGYLPVLEKLVDRAIGYSKNEKTDIENIRALGEGWVAEETLAIAVYCSLRYSDDFSKGVIAAVNHSGDSDSTGAVTGNILGAWLGYDAVEEKWKRNLELKNIILEMADDLCHGCQLSEYSSYKDPVWAGKYIECQYRKKG